MTVRPTILRPAVLLTAASLVALAIAGCGGTRESKREAAGSGATTPGPVAVRTAAVTSLEAATSTTSATVQARQRAALTSRLAAAVRSLPLEEGAPVRAGQVVVRLDDVSLRAALAAAEAQHAAAAADATRYANLLARQAATARESEAATARAAGAVAAVAAARDALAYAELRSPFAGRLARRLVREGDVVTPGQPLVEIEGEGGYELRATVTGAEAAALSPGQALAALVDGAGEVAGTVRSVSPAGDPGTHRFEVVADLAPFSGLRSGQFARLRLPALVPRPADAAAATGVAVPAAAVFTRGGLTGVFVVADGAARLRWVAIGETRGDSVVVRAGLAAGERVVLAPAGLADGAPVTEIAEPADAEPTPLPAAGEAQGLVPQPAAEGVRP
jgi:RND family efflux transporter MFP subunit